MPPIYAPTVGARTDTSKLPRVTSAANATLAMTEWWRLLVRPRREFVQQHVAGSAEGEGVAA